MQLNRDLSLFSPQALALRHNRALLLQFVLLELFGAHRAFFADAEWISIFSHHPRFFPYDWAVPSGFLNRMHEHGILLKKSFPDLGLSVKKFEQIVNRFFSSWEKKKKIVTATFQKAIREIYFALEPLLEACKENENLLFFLLKHRSTIDSVTNKGYLRNFLLKMHPCGLETLGEKMCDKYHQRGFISQIPELKLLIADLIHD